MHLTPRILILGNLRSLDRFFGILLFKPQATGFGPKTGLIVFRRYGIFFRKVLSDLS
jgi:hypothetical protein